MMRPLALATVLLATVAGQEWSPEQCVSQLADARQRPEAERQLLVAGVDAVPALLAAVGSETEATRVAALSVLGQLAPVAGEVIDRMVDRFPAGKPSPAEWLARRETLAALLPYSEKYTNADPPGDVRSFSQEILALGKRLPGPSEPIPRELEKRGHVALMRLEVRAAFVLRADSSSDDLLRGLEDPRPAVRELAAELLRISDAAPAAIAPRLSTTIRRWGDSWREIESRVESFRDGDPMEFRAAIAAALTCARAAPDHPDSVFAHAVLLRFGGTSQRVASVRGLQQLGEDASAVELALLSAVDDPGHTVACEAITALGGVIATDPATRRTLERLVADEDLEKSARACAALRVLRER